MRATLYTVLHAVTPKKKRKKTAGQIIKEEKWNQVFVHLSPVFELSRDG